MLGALTVLNIILAQRLIILDAHHFLACYLFRRVLAVVGHHRFNLIRTRLARTNDIHRCLALEAVLLIDVQQVVIQRHPVVFGVSGYLAYQADSRRRTLLPNGIVGQEAEALLAATDVLALAFPHTDAVRYPFEARVFVRQRHPLAVGYLPYHLARYDGLDQVHIIAHLAQLLHVEHYQEGPWLYKRKNNYYLAYASTCCPEALGYAMSNSPEGPWEAKGYIMRPTPRDRGNHPGICEYKGHNYVFGQNYDLMHIDLQEHHERRTVTFTEMEYNADGTIKEVPYWLDQNPVNQLHWLNPYQRVEAETMNWGYGLKSAKMGIANTGVIKDMPYSTGKKNMYIYDIDNDEYIRLRGVDFGSKSARQFLVAAAAEGSCQLTLRLNAADGPVIGTMTVKSTGSVEKYKTFTAKVSQATGVHDLYICFDRVEGDVRLDYWQFKK